ncbi:hypothetical protein FRB90_001606 [Tulasnella sp. 427]|nr:hypothetical protein FRB90_001606 [Tulasnella sp. 427]
MPPKSAQKRQIISDAGPSSKKARFNENPVKKTTQIPTTEFIEDAADDGLEGDAFSNKVLEELEPSGQGKRKGRVKTEGYESDSSDDGEGVVESRKKARKKKDGDEDDDDVDMFGGGDDRSDEEPAAANTKKKSTKFMALGDIEGQEFGGQATSDADEEDEPEDEDDAIRRSKKGMGFEISSFNMKDEMEEGKFDDAGMFVRSFDPHQVHDRWMEGMDESEIKKAKRSRKKMEEREAARKHRVDEEEGLSHKSKEQLELELLDWVRPGESVLQTLGRLGAEKKKNEKPKPKQKTKSAKAVQDPTADAERDPGLDHPSQHPENSAIDRVTALASALMSMGNLHVYDETHRTLLFNVREASLVGKDWVPPSAAPPPAPPTTKYEYRWAPDYLASTSGGAKPDETFGPFTKDELLAWKAAAYFGTSGERVQLRKVGGGDSCIGVYKSIPDLGIQNATMTSKYANLPDIDHARDVYETEDLDPALEEGLSDEEDLGLPLDDRPPGAELDGSRLPDRNGVGRFFRKAERKKPRRTVYTYPPSPTASRSPSPGDPSTSTRGPPLRARLRALQQELSALESEISDPSNPLLLQEADVDTGEMLKGLVEVRGRLTSLSGNHLHGVRREELVEKAVKAAKIPPPAGTDAKSGQQQAPVRPTHVGRTPSIGENKAIVELDRRVAELEKFIGATTTVHDESSPLPAPLLPQINRMSNQLALLTQPRHIDSISRRIKVLVADLERHQAITKRTTNPTGSATSKDQKEAGGAASSSSAPAPLPPDLAPILQRLSPLLPTIPHLLQRLRTLSTLHTSASSFASSLAALEDEQKRVHNALAELDGSVKEVEKSIGENVGRVEGNLKGMEARLDDLMGRLALLSSDNSKPATE